MNVFFSILSDWSYVPYYDNVNDSEDGKIAKGYSYHQGPVSFKFLISFILLEKRLFVKDADT